MTDLQISDENFLYVFKKADFKKKQVGCFIFSAKKYVISKILFTFATGIREKSCTVDAIAYCSHLTEEVWKTRFGIVRINSGGKS